VSSTVGPWSRKQIVVLVVVLVDVVVGGGAMALHVASPVPVLQTSFAPVPPAIGFQAQPVNAEQ
jgi:hypothetical protein